jgi:Zn-dependent peptidase ImmA (M78 family)/DNA-binding XRE family transcriptional regulator
MYGDIINQNIKRLRKIKGLKQEEIAKKAELSRLAYLNIENGKNEPRSGTLLKIAKALSVDIREFFNKPVEFQSLRFRIGKTHTTKEKNARDYELLKLSMWLEDYNYLENELNNKLSFKLHGLAMGDPVEIAYLAREKIGLDKKEPIFDICSLLEKSGVKIYLYKPILKKCFGMSLGQDDGGPVIAINIFNSIPIERQIFTSVHELGHLILHKDSYKANILEENEQEEKEADEFASYFLMPEESFIEKWEETYGLHWVNRVLQIKRIYKVSYKTVLKRLISFTKAGENIYQQFAFQYNALYQRSLKNHYESNALEEPEALLKADFMADRLNRLVREAYEKEIISMSKAAEILGIPLLQMRETVNSWSF